MFQVERKIKLMIMSFGLLIAAMASQTGPVSASSTTTLAAPVVVDKTLRPGYVFSINITVSCVQHLWGYQFILTYDTSVLTVTGYEFLSPFTHSLPSEIDDTAGNVALSASSYMGDPNGLNTVDSVSIARVNFVVDARGNSTLDLHDSVLSDIYGAWIPHDVLDGFFANIHTKVPSITPTSATHPENGAVAEPGSSNTTEAQSGLRLYAKVGLTDSSGATGVYCMTHLYKNYIYPSPSSNFVVFSIALIRENATHTESLEVGVYQNRSGYYRYAAHGGWEPAPGGGARYVYYETYTVPTLPLLDCFLMIVETAAETFEARIDLNVVKTYTFSIHGDRHYQAGGESTHPKNSLRGAFWGLYWRNSSGFWNTWMHGQTKEDTPYSLFLPPPYDSWSRFYTLGGGVLGDVNGDGIVDVLDVGAISACWGGPPAGPLPYDMNSDINGGWDQSGNQVFGAPDGEINILDVTLVSAHYGETP